MGARPVKPPWRCRMAWENNRPTHVPGKVREAALHRDGNRCTATMRDGTRCTETTRLEAAHIQQWQPGETLTVHDVRMLCHWHHNRETQQQARDARKPYVSHVRPNEQHPAFARRKARG